MTEAANTGLTALPENLRAISAQSGIVHASGAGEAFAVDGSGIAIVEGFRSGADSIVLPTGTDLSTVSITADWKDDAWGLRIGFGDQGDGVFLRWGWQVQATDLVVAQQDGAAPSAPIEAPPAEAPSAGIPPEAAPPEQAPPAAAPEPAAPGSTPDGYRLVLEDDFSNGYRYENWGNPFHGGVYWNGAFEWNADDVAVRGGEMQVTMTNHGGWWTAGGFNSFKAGNTIQYGKIEFDAKVPDHQGTMTAILTWPSTDLWPHDGEIDILETPHNENMFSTHYAGPGGEHNYDSIRSSTFDASQWNHYEMTWLPDRLTIDVNGQRMAEWTDPAQIPDVPHGFGAMGFVGSAWDHWMGGAPDGSTPDQVVVSIDNVRMYQADGVF